MRRRKFCPDDLQLEARFVIGVRSLCSFCFLFLAVADVPGCRSRPGGGAKSGGIFGRPSRHFLPRHSKWKDAARGVSRPRFRRYAAADLQRDESFLESRRARGRRRRHPQSRRARRGYDCFVAPRPAQIAGHDSAVARFLLRSGAGFRLAGERIRRSRQVRAASCRWWPSRGKPSSMGRGRSRFSIRS